MREYREYITLMIRSLVILLAQLLLAGTHFVYLVMIAQCADFVYLVMIAQCANFVYLVMIVKCVAPLC